MEERFEPSRPDPEAHALDTSAGLYSRGVVYTAFLSDIRGGRLRLRTVGALLISFSPGLSLLHVSEIDSFVCFYNELIIIL